jgi:hypothetical protein
VIRVERGSVHGLLLGPGFIADSSRSATNLTLAGPQPPGSCFHVSCCIRSSARKCGPAPKMLLHGNARIDQEGHKKC